MTFEIYQWLVPLIAIIFMVRTIREFRRGRRGIIGLVIWILFWCTIILLAIIPNPVSFKIAKVLGFKSNVNAIIFVALGLLFLFVFYLSSVVERLETQITKMVRIIALQEEELRRAQEDQQQAVSKRSAKEHEPK